MLVENKVALITGAGQGIGRGIALTLAKEGAHIIVSDINFENAQKVAEEARGFGSEVEVVGCDVSNKESVSEMFRKVDEKFGRLDILVNNAGIFPFSPLIDMEESQWDKVMEVNVKSLYYCTREALKRLPEGGRIITVSSIASIIGFEGLTHYCASKGAVNGFTHALSLELAPKGITVNAVAPGAISTPGADSGVDEETTNQFLKTIPMGRKGQPEDIANAVTFLASDRASYITGQVIVVDGGWTIR
ncbi:MAG: SDR family oxidoreductase [Candidatus Moraniibacteriota bacterium]|nr:MAG: SDR family oxidoreductase [Candidatus Moranbacteria bacterium]